MNKKEQKNEEILNQIGIDVNDEKIVFDFGKTKAFFENLHEQIQKTTKDMERGIQKGKVDLESSVGFKLDSQKIEIDLHQTKNFMEEIGQKIEHFLGSLEKSFQEKNHKD